MKAIVWSIYKCHLEHNSSYLPLSYTIPKDREVVRLEFDSSVISFKQLLEMVLQQRKIDSGFARSGCE